MTMKRTSSDRKPLALDSVQEVDSLGSLQPVQEAPDDPAYPTVAEASRRGFLQWAAAGAVAGVAGAAGEPEVAARARGRRAHPGHAKPPKPAKPKEEKITVSLPWGLRVGGGSLRAERLVIWTKDKRLARFLKRSQERSGIQTAVGKPVRKAPADTVFDGRKIYKLEQQVTRALARHYRKRTGRRAGHMDLMIHMGRRYPIRTGGVMVRPSRPYRPNLPVRRP